MTEKIVIFILCVVTVMISYWVLNDPSKQDQFLIFMVTYNLVFWAYRKPQQVALYPDCKLRFRCVFNLFEAAKYLGWLFALVFSPLFLNDHNVFVWGSQASWMFFGTLVVIVISRYMILLLYKNKFQEILMSEDCFYHVLQGEKTLIIQRQDIIDVQHIADRFGDQDDVMIAYRQANATQKHLIPLKGWEDAARLKMHLLSFR